MNNNAVEAVTKMRVTYASREEVEQVARSRVRPVNVVLDIGPGIQPQNYFSPRVHICVDAFLPYLEHLQQQVGNDPRYVLINATWETALSLLPDKSVDSVFALDVIEHTEKANGFKLLQEAERVARCQVVVFTPLGYFPQTYENPETPDRWGMAGGFWQTHRSGWTLEDFGGEWEIVCCRDFHLIGEDDHPLDEPIGAFWAFRDLGKASDPNSRRDSPILGDYTRRMLVKELIGRTLSPAAYNSLRSILRIFKRR